MRDFGKSLRVGNAKEGYDYYKHLKPIDDQKNKLKDVFDSLSGDIVNKSSGLKGKYPEDIISAAKEIKKLAERAISEHKKFAELDKKREEIKKEWGL